MGAEEISHKISENIIAYNEQGREHKPDHSSEGIHDDEPTLEHDHDGCKHYPSEQSELIFEVTLLEGEHKCDESRDISNITDQGVIHVDEVQDGVAEGDDWVSPEEDVPKAEVVSQQIEVPVKIFSDGDVGLFLFVSFYRVDFPENEEIQDQG